MNKHRLSTKLASGFALIAFLTIAAVSLTANLLISRKFDEYIAQQKTSFSAYLASSLTAQYNSSDNSWNTDYIHGLGMSALADGYILKLYDSSGNVIWDAENHDMTMCHQVMQEISLKMSTARPSLNGDFFSHSYELEKDGHSIGHVELSFYSPYFFSESDLVFLNSLNCILLAVGIIFTTLAAAAGIIFARHITTPLTQLTAVTGGISKGDYSLRFNDSISTAEISSLRDSINDMAAGLEHQEHLRRRLTSDVAHELRTPIANVSSSLEAIIEGALKPDTERLSACCDELGRISHIISDLEQLSLTESGSLQLKFEQTELLSLAVAAVKGFEAAFREKSIICNVTGTQALVLADRKRILQVISNLLSNAVKYSYSEGLIDITVGCDSKYAYIMIKDNGIGIPESELPFIFERFYRTDISRSRKTGGSGIGLTIAEAIVKAHHGKISAESTEGKGSCFTVFLPMLAD